MENNNDSNRDSIHQALSNETFVTKIKRSKIFFCSNFSEGIALKEL